MEYHSVNFLFKVLITVCLHFYYENVFIFSKYMLCIIILIDILMYAEANFIQERDMNIEELVY